MARMAPFMSRTPRLLGANVDRRGLLDPSSGLAMDEPVRMVSPEAGEGEAACSQRVDEALLLPSSCRPRLLKSLTRPDDDNWCLRVHIVEAGKPKREYERVRLEELVSELWPEADLGTRREGNVWSDWARNICRDIRLLDDFTNQSFLLKATCRAILVRTDFLKAVVEPHRVTFINSDSPTFDMFMTEFMTDPRLSSKMDSDCNECNLGNWVVECIVCASVTLYDMRFKLIKPVGTHILESTRATDFNSVLRLYPLKLTLSTFVEQIRPMVKCLHDLLHWEEDAGERLRMRCNKRKGSHDLGSSFLCHGPDFEACSVFCASLEEALYNWYHNAEEIMSDAVEMCQRIEDSLRFAEASMSCTRNRLLKFELWTMIATVAFGVGALISGVFGMNLDNYGLNNAPGAFWHVCLIITGLIGLITFVSWYAINRSQSHYHTHAPKFGNNRFFREINEDSYVLALCGELPSGDACSACGKKRILQELEAKCLPLGGFDSQSPRGSRRWTVRTSSGGLQMQTMPYYSDGGLNNH